MISKWPPEAVWVVNVLGMEISMSPNSVATLSIGLYWLRFISSVTTWIVFGGTDVETFGDEHISRMCLQIADTCCTRGLSRMTYE